METDRFRPRLGAGGAACLSRLWSRSSCLARAGSAPLRSIVLGQTAEMPKPSCPGKIVNGVEIIPCRVEGHVTGFQTIADGLASPFEAPFEGKVVAWSISLARPSTKKTDDDHATSSGSSTNCSAPRHRRGSASCARSRNRNRRATNSSARARSRSSTTTSAPPRSSPSTTRWSCSRARSSPSPFPPGRRCSRSKFSAEDSWRAAGRRQMHKRRKHRRRPPPAGDRLDQEIRLLLLQRPPALQGVARASPGAV